MKVKFYGTRGSIPVCGPEFQELKTKRGWGHSSYEQALQVAEMAGVKMLAITHHDPDHDDEFLRRMERQCQQRFRACVLAREKMEIAL
jgi:ribonuclease BN (tRNA processing enzyme)